MNRQPASPVPMFRQKNGLTNYAFACGYIQRAACVVAGQCIRVDLWHEGAAYHVRAHNFTSSGRLSWDAFHSLADARKAWEDAAWLHFGNALREISKDRRYSYRQEFHGEAEQSYVVRFAGEWVGKSDTVVGAMLVAYAHKHEDA